MLYFVKSYCSRRKNDFHMGNEWACDSDSDSTFHTWLQLWSCICLNSLPTKYCLPVYLLKLISIFGHFLTVNNRRYGRCYVKIFITPCTFLEFYTQLEANSVKSFRNAFCKCSRALDIMFLKTSYFWWMSSFFSLSSHLKLPYSFRGISHKRDVGHPV